MDRSRKGTWIRCIDKDTNKDTVLPPCVFAITPDDAALTAAGYIWCTIDFCHYLANADRPCKDYSNDDTIEAMEA